MKNIQMFNKAEIYSFISGLTACLGICVGGINSGIISPIITELKRDNLVTEKTLPILTTLYFIGSISGYFLTGYIASIGRKKFWIISLSLISYLANYIFLLGLTTVSMFVARFALGVHDAIVFSLFIVYTGEVVMDTRKKLYGTGLGVSLRLSILVVYLLGVCIGYKYIVIVSMALYSVVILIMLFQPTSPHWLIKKGYFHEGEKVLLHIYQDETVAAEKFSEIRQQQQQQQQEGEITTTFVQKYKFVLKWSVLKPILIVSILQILKELTGHEIIVGYCSVILSQHISNQTTHSTISPNLQELAYPSLLGVGSIISLFISTRKRVKAIIIATTVGQLIAHLSMTLYFIVTQYQLINQASIYLFIWGEASIAMYGLFFSIGWGSLIYYLYIELFNPQYRELSSAICCVAMDLATIGGLAIYGYIIEMYGGMVVFSAFSVTCVFAVIFQIVVL